MTDDITQKKEFCHLNSTILFDALKNAFRMLNPIVQIRNPIIFVTYLGTLLSFVYLLSNLSSFSWFNFQISLWLFLTVLFANFAQALAESLGKAQVVYLKKPPSNGLVKQIRDGQIVKVPINELLKEDIVVCEAGDIIPADGEVIKGIATVDESAITGESAPVIRESSSDRSAVTEGTKVLSDQLIIRITAKVENSIINKMIQQTSVAYYSRTPNEMALNVISSGLAIIFLISVASMKFFSDYTTSQNQLLNFPILIALFISLIPTTIAALLNSVGITSMIDLVCNNVIAKSNRVVETTGDIDLMILDKTGTITLGNRMATAFIPVAGIEEQKLAQIAQLASLSDETPEGRSIVVLAKEKFGLRKPEVGTSLSKFIPFSAQTRMSGIDFFDPHEKVIRSIRKGAPDAIRQHIEKLGGVFPDYLNTFIESISLKGGTPFLVSDDKNIVGIIHLKDALKGGIKERFAEMRKMGMRTLMITGDHPLTAAAIAAEAGIDDFIAEATPAIKLQLIKEQQKKGLSVAMIGDGTNDAPALAQADIGVAMNTGTQTSRAAGNMIDLDSNPTKLLHIVKIGKHLLMTRGVLMIFSITSSLVKYFAIIPAIFGHLYTPVGKLTGPLSMLNIMKLQSPKSAILSLVIFNALTILFLLPLILRGIQYHAQPAYSLLRSNIVMSGIGGIIISLLGIKLIDMALHLLRWV